ncbi:MAG: metal ABC transporter permease [Eubacteriales bacterium]|nr:metal ABC transporter permease [Eubacteriales bacterium]
MGIYNEVFYVLLATAVACAIPGNFLVLRKWSMMGDGISHSVLLGIVLAYAYTHSLESPLLLIGATVFALLTVYFVEWIMRSGNTQSDAALGISYTLFFAIAVIIISRYFRHSHIDIDVVLLGDATFAPVRRIVVAGISMPFAMFQMSVIAVLNLVLILVFYKGFKVSGFDGDFSAASGFSLLFFQLMLMSSVSLTTVAAFDAVGAILVISFLVAPAATAYLICKQLNHMIMLSILITAVNSFVGCLIAIHFNVTFSASVASMAGLTFFLALFFGREGVIAKVLLRHRLKRRFKDHVLLLHLYQKRRRLTSEGAPVQLSAKDICRGLQWDEWQYKRCYRNLLKQNLAVDAASNEGLKLTEQGLVEAERIRESYGLNY